MNTDTPETFKSAMWSELGWSVDIDFARKLERERDEWKAKYIQQNKDLGCELRDPNGTIWDHAKTLQRELDEAREALRTGGMLNIIDRAHHERAAAIRERDEAREELDRGLRENQELWASNAELTEQRDSLAEVIEQLKSQLTQTQGTVTISRNGYVQELEQQRDRLAEALRSIKNELGVPQPEYPAPVANAVKIADEAL
jgi:chromosome segregation ATPase